jgi:hypothetical protein
MACRVGSSPTDPSCSTRSSFTPVSTWNHRNASHSTSVAISGLNFGASLAHGAAMFAELSTVNWVAGHFSKTWNRGASRPDLSSYCPLIDDEEAEFDIGRSLAVADSTDELRLTATLACLLPNAVRAESRALILGTLSPCLHGDALT